MCNAQAGLIQKGKVCFLGEILGEFEERLMKDGLSLLRPWRPNSGDIEQRA
jgi:hypothetical protein